MIRPSGPGAAIDHGLVPITFSRPPHGAIAGLAFVVRTATQPSRAARRVNPAIARRSGLTPSELITLERLMAGPVGFAELHSPRAMTRVLTMLVEVAIVSVAMDRMSSWPAAVRLLAWMVFVGATLRPPPAPPSRRVAARRSLWCASTVSRYFALLGTGVVAGFFALGFFADTERVSFHWPLPGYLALLPLVTTQTVSRPWFWALPFLFTFIGGVFADILETRYRKLFLTLTGLILATQAAACITVLNAIAHQT